MASRLDRLFILLETGTNPVTKKAAAQQLGEAQRLHPHELHHLLARVSTLLKSPQWDTRVSAAQAIQAILSQVPVWDPQPVKEELSDHKKIQDYEFLKNKLTFQDFDIDQILAKSSHLTGSEGSEYDLVIAEHEQQQQQQSTNSQENKFLTTNLGFNPRLMNIDTSDLFTTEDLTPIQLSSNQPVKISLNEMLRQSSGLSRREINRARRKARQSISKQRSREPDDQSDSTESLNKKIKLEDIVSTDTTTTIGITTSTTTATTAITTTTTTIATTTTTATTTNCDVKNNDRKEEINISCGGAVPDGTGNWPDTILDWPLEVFGENLCQDLFSQKWEIRHGAATALRELVRLHGKSAGKSRNQTIQEMNENHRRWIIDASLRLLCVLALDRFGDFVSDQVVAPVRETCAQALGSLVLLITNNDDIMNILKILLKLLEYDEWEARHGALLALKYLFAIRDDLLDQILPYAFPAVIKGLSDAVDDVGAAAASALIPVASALPRLLTSSELEAIIARLWELLRNQDDLAAACNSFMGLLAAILSLPTARASISPQPLSQVLPQLWPFLSHVSSSVRKATLQTLQTLTGKDTDFQIKCKEKWGNEGSFILQEALRHVFQRALIEHEAPIQQITESVWENLVIHSDLELLLHAVCPLVSTWLCLAMQPDHAPFNPALLINYNNITNSNLSKSLSKVNDGQSELKVYIGGTETVPHNIRLLNTIRVRIMATRMLGLLSRYVVKPAPGVIYTPDIPSPALCYARVLLAHLTSRSSLQRTVVGLTIAHWASLEQPNPPKIPDILKDKLLGCLSECIYYDEIAGAFTRLLHDSNDYIATLKHYKLNVPIDIDSNTAVMTLDQITTLSSKSVTELQSSNNTNTTGNVILNKLKPKLITSLEERRKALEVGASNTATQQLVLNVMSMAALAGAATMLHCLPEPPQPLNPLVKPLMEAIKREEDNDLQKLAARHLAHLIHLCTDRKPSPNNKITTNLCTFLCSDNEFTPRVSQHDIDPYDGIITLNNRQKYAERIAYNRGTGLSGVNSGRGPGRPPATEIPLDELLAYEEPEAKAAKNRRRGATYALTAIAQLIGSQLPIRLPHLWNIIIMNDQTNNIQTDNNVHLFEQVNNLIYNLQVLEIIAPSLDKLLLPPIIEFVPKLCQLLAHSYKAVRHMASRCIATLAVIDTENIMQHVVQFIIPLLEVFNVESDNVKNNLPTPGEAERRRQGASEALTCIVESLGVNVVPYAVLFMIRLLGRMSDQNQAVRLISNSTFAMLVQLLPLDPGLIVDSQLVDEKIQERRFLEQLLNPRNIPDTKLTIKVSAELRSYQQQGLNWLDFLNRYKLHGVLCDDMGLGKTLQTLCIITLDHYRNTESPPSLVVCPLTLTGHWVYEAEKFFDKNDLPVLQYAGTPLDRERLRSRVSQYRLIIASYDILRKDLEFFETIQWNYCVLDEGHIIKNGKTKNAKAAKRLHAYHRLILSGTPVQNDVLELWSLFDFLMPGFLGSEKQFAAKYSRPILACRESKAGQKEQEAGALAMESLHRQVLPFLLRRNKEDVLNDLPPKITQDYYCELSPLQKTLYEDFQTRHATLVTNITLPLSSDKTKRSHGFETLQYLRNVCNHPKLVLGPRHPLYNNICQMHTNLSDIEHSAKLPALKQLLLDCGIGQSQQQLQQKTNTCTLMDNQQLVSQHRALIFCQLKAMLDIVEKDLLSVHLPTVTYLRLDGSIPALERHGIVSRFNADPSIDVLLLTTQVGGVGLNLTGADTVIFIEHDWNPMKDLQAMDRAHRIGQKKVVNVYRLITRGTLEEKIMDLQKFKLYTAKTIISTDNASLATMGTEQLLDLFSLENGEDKKSKDNHDDSRNISGIPGISKSVLAILPELWEQQQYDDEYDLDSYLTSLKGSN